MLIVCRVNEPSQTSEVVVGSVRVSHMKETCVYIFCWTKSVIFHVTKLKWLDSKICSFHFFSLVQKVHFLQKKMSIWTLSNMCYWTCIKKLFGYSGCRQTLCPKFCCGCICWHYHSAFLDLFRSFIDFVLKIDFYGWMDGRTDGRMDVKLGYLLVIL